MKTILISIDDSPYSTKAAKTGVLLAKKLNAKIVLIHVVDNGFIMSDGGYTPSDMIRSMKDEAKTFLKKIQETFSCQDALTFIEVGKPSNEILKTANAVEADVIVLGTHGRTGLTRVLMGSVAEDIVRHSKIPVLVVPFKALSTM